jgi:hypothetical protein
MAGSVTAELKKLESKWQTERARAKKDGLGGAGVPDGKYIARLTGFEVDSTGNGLRLKIPFVCLEGTEQGKPINKSDGLDGPDSLYYTAKLMARFGYDPEEFAFSDLPKIGKELVKSKPVCELQVKTKQDFQNVYVNRVLEDYDESEGADTDEEEEETEAGDEEEGETVEITEGTRVGGTFRGTAYEGEVIEVVDSETLRVKRDDTGSVIKVKVENVEVLGGGTEPADEEEEEGDEEEPADEAEEIEIAIGMRVGFPWKGSNETGEVREVVDEERVKVKKDSDGKIATVKIENCELLDATETEATGEEEEEEEEEAAAPAPKPKTSTKTAATAAKPATAGKTGKPATATRKK